jgi:peroxiredoxin family protein
LYYNEIQFLNFGFIVDAPSKYARNHCIVKGRNMQTLELKSPYLEKRNKLVIVCSKGSLDMAYPPLTLATTGAAMGMEVDLYFTFWGINMVRKKSVDSMKVSPVGNPAMPMPNILGMIPGMTRLATRMMSKKMEGMKMPSIKEMIKTAHEAGVHFHACSQSMQMMNLTKEDLIPEVDDIIGATTYLDLASDNAITLFV